MDKAEILEAIERFAEEDGGVAVGKARFEKLTGISEAQWGRPPLGQDPVCLMKSGAFFKIGRSNAAGGRAYELAIQLPEKLEVVHVIETHDAVGIVRAAVLTSTFIRSRPLRSGRNRFPSCERGFASRSRMKWLVSAANGSSRRASTPAPEPAETRRSPAGRKRWVTVAPATRTRDSTTAWRSR